MPMVKFTHHQRAGLLEALSKLNAGPPHKDWTCPQRIYPILLGGIERGRWPLSISRSFLEICLRPWLSWLNT